jgi:hypothetical protein
MTVAEDPNQPPQISKPTTSVRRVIEGTECASFGNYSSFLLMKPFNITEPHFLLIVSTYRHHRDEG